MKTKIKDKNKNQKDEANPVGRGSILPRMERLTFRMLAGRWAVHMLG